MVYNAKSYWLWQGASVWYTTQPLYLPVSLALVWFWVVGKPSVPVTVLPNQCFCPPAMTTKAAWPMWHAPRGWWPVCTGKWRSPSPLTLRTPTVMMMSLSLPICLQWRPPTQWYKVSPLPTKLTHRPQQAWEDFQRPGTPISLLF